MASGSKMNPKVNNRICHVVEVIGELLATQKEWQHSPESSWSFVLGACSSRVGSSAGTDVLTDGAAWANLLSSGLPRTMGYFCSAAGKTQLFFCVFGKVLCQEMMCMWCCWLDLGNFSGFCTCQRQALLAVSVMSCVLLISTLEFHSFGSCSYQTL